MALLVHIFLFLFSAAVIWFFAGLLIESVNRVAQRFHKNGFTIAFFILGFLTSISEISVATSATIDGVPQVSVGNLVGASFVILFFIIPLLATLGRGVELRHTLSQRNLVLALGVILLPALVIVDGNVTRSEGLLTLIVYITLLFAIKSQKDKLEEVVAIQEKLVEKSFATWRDGVKILIGGIFIFVAGHFLVEQAVYFANYLSVPSSLIGLILLSVGTNVPELVIAVRSILKAHKEIAFGDYIGSAATNTPIFGILALANGNFSIEASEFMVTVGLMFVGFVLFYFFARSDWKLSKQEGLVLLVFYGAFLCIQLANLLRFSVQ